MWLRPSRCAGQHAAGRYELLYEIPKICSQPLLLSPPQVLRKTLAFLLLEGEGYDSEELARRPAAEVAAALAERGAANRARWLRGEAVVGRVVETDLEWFYLKARCDGGAADELALFEGWAGAAAAPHI